ncbi:murein L,D-transpeptidase catalytic domain-containing protein [Halobacteriovorax sp.]|uniref:murein L,D-transpeptidase catalytic domain-containing protein n=1 Tax=Halobacteriovorax sp. TaxID=2020862 RepID=UPI00356642D2
MKNLILITFLFSLNSFAFDGYDIEGREETINHFVAEGVPETPLVEAMDFFVRKGHLLDNKRYITIGDFSQSSKEKRLYILDLDSGELQREYVAHGSGRNRVGYPNGDRDHDGYLNKCKHSKFSRRIRLVKHRRYGMTRPGFMRVDDTYFSSKFNYNSMEGHNAIRLTGLESSTSDVRRNAVVFHEASYVKDYSKIQGRTLGCPAIAVGTMKNVLPKIKGGSLYYSYAPQC